ncbi:MAG: hypothetical protein JWP01_3393 [Myxococcales bacterium]|nr:hypothetical protein [Myxococcales bacterium]
MPLVLPHDCPPTDALDCELEVYYVVKVSPCEATDFQTHAERNSQRNADPCNRCGLSVWKDEADARYQAGKHPRLGNMIARGRLQAEHGKLKQTYRPSHHTWWPADDVERHSIFEVIATV